MCWLKEKSNKTQKLWKKVRRLKKREVVKQVYLKDVQKRGPTGMS